MHSTQKLTNVLRRLVELVEEEASRNPDFASRLECILAPLPVAKRSKAPKQQVPALDTPLPDVFTAVQEKGEDEFRFWLRSLTLPTLKAIVKVNGFDVAKTSLRWTEPDKFVALIAEQTIAQLKRGSAFLTPKKD